MTHIATRNMAGGPVLGSSLLLLAVWQTDNRICDWQWVQIAMLSHLGNKKFGA